MNIKYQPSDKPIFRPDPKERCLRDPGVRIDQCGHKKCREPRGLEAVLYAPIDPKKVIWLDEE